MRGEKIVIATTFYLLTGVLSWSAETDSSKSEQVSASTQLTWPALVGLAAKNNPDLQASREAILNSEAVRKGAYSTIYPHISADFNFSRGYSGLPASSNYSSEYSEEVSLSQTIFDGFATKGNIDHARAELNLAFAELNGTKASVSYSLKSSFAQLIYAQKLIELSRNVITIRESNARLVKILYDGGTEDKGAMLLSQANYDQAKNDYNAALRTRNLSELQVCVAAGVDLPSPILAIGELETGPILAQPNFRRLAVVTPVYYEHRAAVDAAAAGLTVASSNWYPSVSAGANASRSGDEFPFHSDSWSTGVSVSYSIFDGGRTYFNVKAANAALRESLANLQSGNDQSALLLAGAFKSVVDTQSNVGIQKELLDATALRYKISATQYQNGLASFQDFDTITESYVSQQKSYLASLRDAVIAEASWEEARGLGAIP